MLFKNSFYTMTTEEMTEEAYLDCVTSDSPSACRVASSQSCYPPNCLQTWHRCISCCSLSLLFWHLENHCGSHLNFSLGGVFSLRDLGNLRDSYVIKLTKDAVPRAIYTPRTVALPMRPVVQKELDRMESIKYYIKESTQGCAEMVAIPKKSGL